MLRLLIYAVPGAPCFELGEKISDFYDLAYLSIEKVDEKEDSYFDDKIPEIPFDTGDFMSGSESQHFVRDPRSMRIDNELENASAYISDPQDYDDVLSEDEISFVFQDLNQGIIATEIPDRRLIDWATHVIFLEADESGVVDWFSKRRFCPTCTNVHHLEDKPPTVKGKCDRCGSDLARRPEDAPEEIKAQFKAWRNGFWKFEETAKQKEIYKRLNVSKLRDFQDLCSRVNLWVRNDIEYRSDNWWDTAKEIL